ncbi:hypothetical protein [Cytobacillus praedii]|uniref:hypothetical protein n=1 Tax=Cytobacillus praedii TaxID=1742358 RepID=UPI002E1A2727|nr:hypothetical protein [Cytobacillus praedii]
MKKLLLIVFSGFLVFVSGCESKEGLDINSSIVASEKSLPVAFDQMSTIDKKSNIKYIVLRVKNNEDYQEMWDTFQFKQDLKEVDLEKSDVIFLGLYESSSCPYSIKEIDTAEKSKVNIVFSDIEGSCTADESPRSFVIAIDKTSSNNIAEVALVQDKQKIVLPIVDK